MLRLPAVALIIAPRTGLPAASVAARVTVRNRTEQSASSDGTHSFLIFFSLLRWERSGGVRPSEPVSSFAVPGKGMFLHLARFGHSLENHVNRRLRILILSEIVTEA